MYLIVNANGKYWDGTGWVEKGKTFLSLASAARSLHEEGEEPSEACFLEIHDSATSNSTWNATALRSKC